MSIAIMTSDPGVGAGLCLCLWASDEAIQSRRLVRGLTTLESYVIFLLKMEEHGMNTLVGKYISSAWLVEEAQK